MPPLILITRPRDGAEIFATDLMRELGTNAEISISPLLTVDLLTEPPDLVSIRTLIFTSAHAVESFAKATSRRDFICYTVGEATAGIASNLGFAPLVGSGTGKALADRIICDTPPTLCLYLHGDHIAFDIAAHLNSAGIETRSAVMYRQRACPISQEALTKVERASTVVAPVFSPRSAELLLDALPKGANLHVAAISDAVARVIPGGRAAKIRVALRPDKHAMLSCVAKLWSDANRLESGSTAQ